MSKTRKVVEHNIIKRDEYREHAMETLQIISDTLSQSLGYYGSTSILEDNILGNTVTKDGYTILNQIKFGPSDTISNTLLNMIKDISRSLVMEVGDGSTSAVVTSKSLFDKLVSDSEFNKKYENVPPKIIIDSLNKIEKLVKEELKGNATQINEDNFERLKDIASISNNNDEASGNIIYEIYKEIGKDGFIVLEKGYTEEDTYEIADGIEISFGLVDDTFTNKANGFEGEYNHPQILMVNGQLDFNDIEWCANFIGQFYSKTPNTPLIFVSTGYDQEFLNFLKINYKENNRKAGIQMAATTMMQNKSEELHDLATYLNAKVLDKSDDILYDQEIDPFLRNDLTGITQFLNEDLGSCETCYMNLNFSRFIDGAGTEKAIEERVSHIQKEIDYIKEVQSSHKDISKDMHRLEKRIGNLRSQIAKLYISGNSDTEIEARKYLFEDAIYASKSALEHGYLAGGNLAVSRAINELNLDVEEETENHKELTKDLANLVKDSFLEVYKTVLRNAFYDEASIDNIILNCINDDIFYDVKSMSYDILEETPVINSVMTDIRIMESVFSIIGLLVTSNQYIQKMPKNI